MSGFKTAFVHIGMHKTGTTSIQQTMARHRALLRDEYGVVYPAVSSNHSIPLFSMFCDQPGAYGWNVIAGTTGKAEISERNAAFAETLAVDLAGPGETLVLSGEDLALLSRGGVQRFKQWLGAHVQSIKILAYVREPVAWATSHAQQQVRQGKTLEALMEGALVPRFRRRLMPWMAAFGRENIQVADFDVARAGPAGLVGHFMAQLGVPDSVHERLAPKLANESLSAEAVTLMSALNALKPTFANNGLSAERRISLDPLFARIKGQRFALPAAAVQRTKSESAAEVAWLAEQFGVQFADAPERSQEEAALFGSAISRDSLALLIWELNEAAEGKSAAEPGDARPRHRLTQRPQARLGR